jgi:Domain of unknown function (DUF3883)
MMHSASEIFNSVRVELLGEAQSSPGLLADLANLERYIAETYSARSFIELLQNADDAHACRFFVTRHGDWLVCANDGRKFSRQDFYSLCRSASSAKQRGQTIGYRGIGFKSVVGVATSVHLLSGDLRATFSRELTQACLGSQAPTPLVRIPHPLALPQNETVLNVVRQLEQSGYTTVFVLGGLDIERVQDEFDQFDADYLLFLRHIGEATLVGSRQHIYHCERRTVDSNSREVMIGGGDRHSTWRIEHFGQCDIAISLVENKAVPLNGAAAIAHAFLPTLESTGFGVRINADFSTDPSRTRIIFDDATLACVDDAAQAIADKISKAIFSPVADTGLLACFTPTTDLATIALQKRSFRTELISRVKKRLDYLKEKSALAPSWLNTGDASCLAGTLNQTVLVLPGSQREVQVGFMRYLGVKSISIESIIKAAETGSISAKGCAELVAQCVRGVVTGTSLRQLVEKPVWKGTGAQALTSLTLLAKNQIALADEFVEDIKLAGINTVELVRMLKSAGLSEFAIAIFLPQPGIATLPAAIASELRGTSFHDVLEPQLQAVDPLLMSLTSQSGTALLATFITSRSLPAWRGAEQYVAMMFSEYGYQIEDRSRQNLGYDIYVEKNDIKYYIEVKLLDYAGQPFTITTNEEVVARESGDSYIIALVLRSSDDSVHIQLIRHPTSTMKFIRQCRQWVWECSDYEFKPNLVAK